MKLKKILPILRRIIKGKIKVLSLVIVCPLLAKPLYFIGFETTRLLMLATGLGSFSHAQMVRQIIGLLTVTGSELTLILIIRDPPSDPHDSR